MVAAHVNVKGLGETQNRAIDLLPSYLVARWHGREPVATVRDQQDQSCQAFRRFADEEDVMDSCALHLFRKRIIRSVVSGHMAGSLKGSTGPERRIAHRSENLIRVPIHPADPGLRKAVAPTSRSTPIAPYSAHRARGAAFSSRQGFVPVGDYGCRTAALQRAHRRTMPHANRWSRRPSAKFRTSLLLRSMATKQ